MKKVLAGGCFNKIHEGHIYFLKKAKELGYLVVVLANDMNNRKPYAVPAKKRKKNLEKLGIADKIIVGDTEDFSKVVKKEKPDIIVLGYDQKLPVKKRNIVVKRIRKFGNHSTKRMKEISQTRKNKFLFF